MNNSEKDNLYTTLNNKEQQESKIIVPENNDLKKLIEDSAKLVLKNGLSFERSLINQIYLNPQLSFLNESDKYRAYYEFILKKIKNDNIKKPDISNINKTSKNIETLDINYLIDNFGDSNNIFNQKELFYVKVPNSITEELNEIIKTTAIFVATNGQSFINVIQKKELNNKKYDFLKPSNKHFTYFTDLVRSYTNTIYIKSSFKQKLLIYSKLVKDDKLNIKNIDISNMFDNIKLEDRLKKAEEINNYITEDNYILKIAKNKLNYNRKQDIIKEKEQKKLEEERLKSLNSTDFNKFIIVEEVNNFNEFIEQDLNDVLQANINNIIRKEIIEDSKDFLNKKNIEVSNKLNNENTENSKEYCVDSNYQNIKVIKNYDYNTKYNNDKLLNKKLKKQKDNAINCPVCNQYIPEDEFDVHIKVELLDPKWKDIKDEIKKRKEENSLNNNLDMINCLKEFAKGRPDLFGKSDEVYTNSNNYQNNFNIENKNKNDNTTNSNSNINYNKTENIESNVNQLTWDGFAPNMTRTTANIAMIQMQNKKNYEMSKKQEEKANIVNYYKAKNINNKENNNNNNNDDDDYLIMMSNLGENKANK